MARQSLALVSARAPSATCAAASEIFDVRITPHRALSAGASLALVVAICAGTVVVQAAFALAGAWPAAVFLGFDALFLVIALISVQASLHRHEDIALRDGAVIVTRNARGKPEAALEIACFGLSVEGRRDPEFGLLALHLRNRHTRIEIARDLSPGERDAFLDAFLASLRRAGHRPRIDIVQSAAHPV